MAQTVKSPNKHREINFCAKTVDPFSMFHRTEAVCLFDPEHTRLDKLLVFGGVFRSFKQARDMNYSGPIPYGWTGEIINGVGVFIYNPDPKDLYLLSNDLDVPWHDMIL